MTSTSTEFAIPVELRPVHGIGEPFEAHIARVTTGFVMLHCPLPLEPGQQLDLFFLNRSIPCEAANCVKHAPGNYRAGLHLLEESGGVSRVERRIELNASAQLSTSSFHAPSPVRVIDMSSSGLGVTLDYPVEVGELAYVEMEQGVAFGEIRHCKKLENGFRAGIFVEEFISRVPSQALALATAQSETSETKYRPNSRPALNVASKF